VNYDVEVSVLDPFGVMTNEVEIENGLMVLCKREFKGFIGIL
jgi:hypothetical protein